ncbi:hypothetical protein BaRGS_00039505 [Batillaria attramentaria]|uniref:Uncharacterized protein n=1 Tax=Batillaria attramentaria TaxID=370345 RepID=A0ABD0J2Z4_9CAEN
MTCFHRLPEKPRTLLELTFLFSVSQDSYPPGAPFWRPGGRETETANHGLYGSPEFVCFRRGGLSPGPEIVHYSLSALQTRRGEWDEMLVTWRTAGCVWDFCVFFGGLKFGRFHYGIMWPMASLFGVSPTADMQQCPRSLYDCSTLETTLTGVADVILTPDFVSSVHDDMQVDEICRSRSCVHGLVCALSGYWQIRQNVYDGSSTAD